MGQQCTPPLVRMPSQVTSRSPKGTLPAAIFKGVWWVLTSLPPKGNLPWLQLRHSINLHKGLSGLVCIGLMMFFDRVTPATCLYTAMHGCYGLLWLAKEALYRDASWETPCTLGSAVLLFFGMQGAFWSSPYLLVTGGVEFEPLPHHLGISLTCFIIGNWLHHSADVQKYFVLRARRGLIKDGFFSRCRNPNYLGEMLIYGSFASMVLRHPCWWFPWTWLAIVWSCLFYPSWLAKDASMSRYPEWPQYTAVSGLFLPWPFGTKELKD